MRCDEVETPARTLMKWADALHKYRDVSLKAIVVTS